MDPVAPNYWSFTTALALASARAWAEWTAGTHLIYSLGMIYSFLHSSSRRSRCTMPCHSAGRVWDRKHFSVFTEISFRADGTTRQPPCTGLALRILGKRLSLHTHENQFQRLTVVVDWWWISFSSLNWISCGLWTH